jgi:hypothetical protein
MSSNGTGESKRGAPLFLLLRGVRAAATLEHMFGHCFWADEFHFQGCEGEVDGVASFGVDWWRETYSATSVSASRTLWSLIHIEHGGTHPPAASSSLTCKGERISGTICATTLSPMCR